LNDAIDGRYRPGDVFDDRRINGVQQPLSDASDCLKADDQDCGSDQQTNDWVRPTPTESHSNRPDQDEERCHTIGAGMDAVSFQCRRSDAAPHPDPVLSDHFISDCANDGGRHDEAQLGDPLGV
jgi:hypothetical protein